MEWHVLHLVAGMEPRAPALLREWVFLIFGSTAEAVLWEARREWPRLVH